ncbi:hypothetical protein KIW84_011244 [Lathyrus oleraceus]|uniref:Transposase-associated domain-containing protein n=1 Tax=Pisum sativum TaxID=3888 RepID=A0A9D4YNU4_PEA|nr:hypothetical protein KIW84_011244 [Pisum sativum]
MDKEWIKENPVSKEYQNGLDFFLDYAYTKGNPRGKEILCPCANCYNTNWLTRNEVRNHLIAFGFQKGYDVWVRHGEKKLKPGDLNDNYMNHEEDQIDDIYGLLHERFRDVVQEENEVNVGLNEDAKKFYNLVEEAKQDLYPGCKNLSKLSFTIRLYLLKCLYDWSNIAFNALLELLREVMPLLNIPVTFSKTKGMIRDLGLDYKKIDVFPNDCMIYWKNHENDTSCHVCGAPRWNEDVKGDDKVEKSHKYFHSGVETRFTRITRNSDICDPHERESSSSCLNVGHPIGGKRKGEAISLDCKSRSLAHRYILFNHEDIQKFIREHETKNPNKRNGWRKAKSQGLDFVEWFKKRALLSDVSENLRKLSRGPNEIARYHAVNLASNDEICEVEFVRNGIPPTIVDNFVPVSDLIESDDDSNL